MAEISLIVTLNNQFTLPFTLLNLGQMSGDQNLLYHQNGLVIRNTHTKYEGTIFKVKNYKQTKSVTDGETD